MPEFLTSPLQSLLDMRQLGGPVVIWIFVACVLMWAIVLERTWYFTKQFHALRQRLGIGRERIGFHSFRKSVATKLEQARIPESEAVQVLGHEKLSMSYRVYSLGVDLKRLKDIVEVVRYSMGSE